MNSPDAERIRDSLARGTRECVDAVEAFGDIGSTNTYLLGQSPPLPGRLRVVIADQQTAGRGRHSRRWVSPPGAGLWLSLAYTFAPAPRHMSSLTLAVGVGIVRALRDLGISGVHLKWPNDIVARDGKLGGILTEVQARGDTATVITGIGINLDLPSDASQEIESDWARQPVDMRRIADTVPVREMLAARIVDALYQVMQRFAADGLAGFAADWAEHDWLRGREITVDMPDRQITGIAAGIDKDGALLIDTGREHARVVSGSVVMAGQRVSA